MKTTIRKATATDMPAVLTLIKELATYEKAAHEVEITVEELIADGFGNRPFFDCLVAEQEQQIVGIALYYYKYSTWKGKCIFLEDIVVKETQRRTGVGSLLFEALINISKELQVKRMEWQVLDWNAPAIAFYEKYNAHLDGEWINCKLTGEQLK